jgi:hypothetical protein
VIETKIHGALRDQYDDMTANADPSDPSAVHAAESALRNLSVRTRVTGAGGELTREGSIASVLADMDAGEVESIVIGNTATAPYPAINLKMQRGTDAKAISLDVSGSDRQWVAGIMDELRREIRRDVPSWAWLRSIGAAILVVLLLFLGAMGWIAIYGATHDDFRSGNWLVPAALVAAFVTVFVYPLLCLIFPGLEVLKPGEDPKGRRTLAWIGGAVGALIGVAGLVLSILSFFID